MHRNQPFCDECIEIIDRYPNFNDELKTWFQAIQLQYEDMHISCAGRGHIDQEVAFQRGASKAHFGHSAHNFNCAIDIFQLKDGKACWDKDWFQKVVGDNIYPGLSWYGSSGVQFYELPHVEIKNWKDLVLRGQVQLVE